MAAPERAAGAPAGCTSASAKPASAASASAAAERRARLRALALAKGRAGRGARLAGARGGNGALARAIVQDAARQMEAELAFGAAGAPPEAQLVRPPITPAQMTPFDSPEEEPRMPMEAAMSDVSEWLDAQEEAELIALVLRELEEASQAELEEHEEAELEELRAAAEEFDKLELGTDGMECPCCRSGVVRADGGETVACDHCDLGVCVGGVGGDGGSHSSGEGALDVLRACLGASLGAHSATGCTAAPAFALHRRAGAVTLQLVCGECGFATEAFTAPAAGSSAAG